MLENSFQQPIYFDDLALAGLSQHLNKKEYSKIFVLVDTNTKKNCLKHFKAKLTQEIDFVIEIKAGEIYKSIETCNLVWDIISSEGGDRKSILINLGGGVVTDLGGFVASTFKRGIDFINVPTTLLAMVDAAIGGKTGVDFGALKNQIGVIKQPEMILILPEFLKTLEKRQVKSGFAEMLKHGLIIDATYWNELSSIEDLSNIAAHINRSTEIKSKVVSEDPHERGLRKILNFGHTLGHAIESYFLMQEEKKVLLHGEAIAIGMILEAYLSHCLTGLSKLELEEIKRVFLQFFEKVKFEDADIEAIIGLLKHDKKNSHGDVNFVLLQTIGKSIIDIQVPENLILESFAHYAE